MIVDVGMLSTVGAIVGRGVLSTVGMLVGTGVFPTMGAIVGKGVRSTIGMLVGMGVLSTVGEISAIGVLLTMDVPVDIGVLSTVDGITAAGVFSSVVELMVVTMVGIGSDIGVAIERDIAVGGASDSTPPQAGNIKTAKLNKIISLIICRIISNDSYAITHDRQRWIFIISHPFDS